GAPARLPAGPVGAQPPVHPLAERPARAARIARHAQLERGPPDSEDRKSTRLNSSHGSISYAVFCLKKKKPEFVSESIRDERPKRNPKLGSKGFGAAKNRAGNFECRLHALHVLIYMGERRRINIMNN